MTNKIIEGKLNRFQNRIMRGFSAYALWRAVKMSLNVKEVGKEAADKNSNIMRRYDDIFSAVLFSLETAFIIELYKFFDKTQKALKLVHRQSSAVKIEGVSLTSSDQKRIKDILNEHLNTIDIIEELRNEIFAHDEYREFKKYNIPPILKLDKLFLDIQEILNIISKNTTNSFYVFPDLNGSETKWFFGELLSDLDLGRIQKWKEREARWSKL